MWLAYYQENRAKILSQQHKYKEEHREENRIRDRKYYQEHKTQKQIVHKNYSLTNRLKRLAKERARYHVSLAGNCSNCGGTEQLERHHPDYDKDLEVVTLCKKCHSRLHATLKIEEA